MNFSHPVLLYQLFMKRKGKEDKELAIPLVDVVYNKETYPSTLFL